MSGIIKRSFKVVAVILATSIILLSMFYKADTPKYIVKEKYANSASRFMPLMGMEVHYRDEGNLSDSMPIVFLHGLSSSLHTWDSLTSKLIDKKRIIRLDLPGFGLTGANPERNYSSEYYNIFIDSFVLKLDVKKYIIVGNSFGGNIAWHQALYQPEKIEKMILINSAGYPRTKEKGNIGFKLASLPLLGEVIKKITPKALIKKSLQDAYSNDEKITEVIENRYYDLLLSDGNRQATVDIFKQRKAPTSEKIKSIHTPTLIIWGINDQMIDVSNAYQFNKDIQGSSIEIISNSGHVPMEETPQPVYEAIVKFIKQG